MRFKDGILLNEINGDFYLVDSGISGKRFNGMIRLNETGAFVAEKLKNETTENEIADAMCAVYDVTRERAVEGIRRAVASFRDTGLIEDA